VIAPVHHQRPLGVDDRLPVPDGLNASRMRLDEDEVVGQGGGEPACGILAERTTPGDKSHFGAPIMVVVP
jgi:hypothetical protein